MRPLPTKCPISGGDIVVTRFYCPDSDITVEGRFYVSAPFAQLSPEQATFVETFVRCEGKLNRMEEELGISYPTIRGRLREVILALGFEPGREEPSNLGEEGRRQVLEQLDRGEISAADAMAMLQGAD